jgi:hypothetical protein
VGIPPLPHAQATSRGGIILHKDGQIHTWIIVVAAASAIATISIVLMFTIVICFKAYQLTFSFAGWQYYYLQYVLHAFHICIDEAYFRAYNLVTNDISSRLD